MRGGLIRQGWVEGRLHYIKLDLWEGACSTPLHSWNSCGSSAVTLGWIEERGEKPCKLPFVRHEPGNGID